jgi:hypothetical protein
MRSFSALMPPNESFGRNDEGKTGGAGFSNSLSVPASPPPILAAAQMIPYGKQDSDNSYYDFGLGHAWIHLVNI